MCESEVNAAMMMMMMMMMLFAPTVEREEEGDEEMVRVDSASLLCALWISLSLSLLNLSNSVSSERSSWIVQPSGIVISPLR
jgi:hypothetical protein